MSPNLARLSRKARANPDLVFTSVYPHIADSGHLRPCYRVLKGTKAVGIDEVCPSRGMQRIWRRICTICPPASFARLNG
ncbi:MAG: hypothetical protein VST67_14285 [Nitrospirota bacterium]|nr:hypothetical protein [Nitrospirota bacterium]